MSQLLGSVTLLGGLIGVVYALVVVFVEEDHRQLRHFGMQLHTLGKAGLVLTPILAIGSALFARVPAEGFVESHEGFCWQLYLAYPMLAFVILACIVILVCMVCEALVDLYGWNLRSSWDHIVAAAATGFYSYFGYKLMSFFELRAAAARIAALKAKKPRNSQRTEGLRRLFAEDGILIHDTDDDPNHER